MHALPEPGVERALSLYAGPRDDGPIGSGQLVVDCIVAELPVQQQLMRALAGGGK